MDALLDGLFGDSGSDDERRAKAEDFVNRVDTGSPTEGFSVEEALTNYSQTAAKMSPTQLEDAAAQALERFSPEQRREFSQLLHQQTGAAADATDDPRQIAQLTSQLQSQSPDGLLGMLGGGGGLESIIGGLLGGGGSSGGGGGISDMIGGLLGGGSRSSSSGAQQGGMGDLLGNPTTQAIMAAIASIAMKNFMGGGDEKAAPAPGGQQPSARPARGAGLKGVDTTDA